MKLSTWVKEKAKISYKDMSRQTGIDYNKLMTYVMGIRSPRYETGQIIIAFTKGEVTWDDLVKRRGDNGK